MKQQAFATQNADVQETRRSETAQAAFVDSRRSNVQQSQVAALANASQQVQGLHRLSSLADGAVTQRKRFDPDGGTYVNKTSEDIWFGEGVSQKGHLFTAAIADQADRTTLLSKIAIKGGAIGANTQGSSFKWVKQATDYDKTTVTKKNDPFRLRIGGKYTEDDAQKTLKLDYHFGPYNQGYVVKVEDHGRTAGMAVRDPLNAVTGATAGAAATFSNRHHHSAGSRLTGLSNDQGANQFDSEKSFDATTKLAGEGARFLCVRGQQSNLADSTYFFTIDDGTVKWVSFQNLWLTWGATFGKRFNIPNSEVAAAISEDKLARIVDGGTEKIDVETGERTAITADWDYNLDKSRSATENDRHSHVKIVIRDTAAKINETRKRAVKKVLNEQDMVVSYDETKSGKTWTVTIWEDGDRGALSAAMPEGIEIPDAEGE